MKLRNKTITVVLLIMILLLAACGSENNSVLMGQAECSTEELRELQKNSTHSGDCGDGCKWFFAENTLVIYGTGKVETSPWCKLFTEGELSDLERIIFDEGITATGNLSSANNDYLDGVKSISLPSTLEEISDHAFSTCHNLSYIFIPKNVKLIDKLAFESSGLEEVDFEEGSQLTQIGEGSFARCYRIRILSIPYGVTSIGDYAFQGSQLAYIDMPDTVEHIGKAAFSTIESDSLLIPESVTSLEEMALTDLNVKEISLPECADKGSIQISPDLTVKYNGNPDNLLDKNTHINSLITYRLWDEYDVDVINKIISEIGTDRCFDGRYADRVNEVCADRASERGARIFGIYKDEQLPYPLLCIFDDSDDLGISDIVFEDYSDDFDLYQKIDKEKIKDSTIRLNYHEIMKVLANKRPIAQKPDKKMTHEWQKTYCSLLKSFLDGKTTIQFLDGFSGKSFYEDEYAFNLIDLTYDGTPELLIGDGDHWVVYEADAASQEPAINGVLFFDWEKKLLNNQIQGWYNVYEPKDGKLVCIEGYSTDKKNYFSNENRDVTEMEKANFYAQLVNRQDKYALCGVALNEDNILKTFGYMGDEDFEAKELTANESWKVAYKSCLNNIIDKKEPLLGMGNAWYYGDLGTGARFGLLDVTGDDIPELFVSGGDWTIYQADGTDYSNPIPGVVAYDSDEKKLYVGDGLSLEVYGDVDGKITLAETYTNIDGTWYHEIPGHGEQEIPQAGGDEFYRKFNSLWESFDIKETYELNRENISKVLGDVSLYSKNSVGASDSEETYRRFLDNNEKVYFDLYDSNGTTASLTPTGSDYEGYFLDDYLNAKKNNPEFQLYEWSNLEYSFIDCGNDGEPELAIKYTYTGEMSEYEGDYVYTDVIKLVDGKLKLCAECVSHYRTEEMVNQYGVISSSFIDFAGANIWLSYSGIDKNGKLESIMDCSDSYAEAIPGIYSGYNGDPDFSSVAETFYESGDSVHIYKAAIRYGQLAGQTIYAYQNTGEIIDSSVITGILDSAGVQWFTSDEYDQKINGVIEEFGLTHDLFYSNEPSYMAVN